MMMGKQVREAKQNSAQNSTSGQFDPRPFASPEPEHETLGREARFGYSFGEIGLFPIQPKLVIGPADDKYEQEADLMAEQVMRMPEPCPKCQVKSEEEHTLRAEPVSFQNTNPLPRGESHARQTTGRTPQVCPRVEAGIRSLNGSGRPLPKSTRAFFEPRFGHDFSQVRVHTDTKAARLAQAVNARAFTTGKDVFLRQELYRPGSSEGQRLLAHELTHVLQQSSGNLEPETKFADAVTSGAVTHRSRLDTSIRGLLQRTLGNGHDLTSPRFSKLLDLEAAYDDEKLIKNGTPKGYSRDVQAIQQALYDLGFKLPDFGADGYFGDETEAAVKAFQKDNPPLAVDGKVGPKTMTALDSKFGAPKLPTAKELSGPWNAACVCKILCPWSPHTVDVLRTRIKLKSFDKIMWTDEEWDGAKWIPSPFDGGGYSEGNEIGVLNSSCEETAETLYHEVLHAEQPKKHETTREKESYAYRIGEEFSIAMGLGGQTSLRSTDVQGREYADPKKVEKYVAENYPSVSASGSGDEIIGKASTYGHVRVQRPNGTIYTRPAMKGEKIEDPNPPVRTNEVTHDPKVWVCP